VSRARGRRVPFSRRGTDLEEGAGVRRVFLAVLLVVALVAACGDDDQTSADALAAAIAADDDPANPLSDAADAQCVADGLVAEFGVARLDALGLTPESVNIGDLRTTGAGMQPEEREAFVAVVGQCIAIGDAYAASATQSGFSEQEARCLVESFSEEVWRQGMLAELSGENWSVLDDPDTSEAAAIAVAECVDFAALLNAELVASGFPEDQADCITDGLTDEMIVDLLPAYFGGEAVDLTQFPDFYELAETCVSGG
jgi:hypothetical protein